ncbi:MAG: F0F1 ATP synthase subunit epsilon [Bacteroidota bacterium]|uniref:F0F1 ATP synthase subunit epsilon n=1 Tax=Christiangramia sp. TaxID=1931228 RepID=UPI000C3BC032|nr:hypothetical protein [Christiangramia sp.]MEE2772217.1 F0F1 ATP synthase subunit epsilon [Bacteroidota bacterium]|tara:strand:+ start:798 stop:1091 length:294 start_codon:yes stop_codon:yes gene_type:complete
MYLEIVTPEAVVFRAEVKAVKVPGHDGEFQMLNHHAPIVSTLVEGDVKIDLPSGGKNEVKPKGDLFRTSTSEPDTVYFHVKGGVLEMKDNKAIILAD